VSAGLRLGVFKPRNEAGKGGSTAILNNNKDGKRDR